MSKSRLSWIFALILVVIASLPVAYAQGFTGSRIFFILINAAVIGVVLFILQAFLLPGKDGKEKTSMWVIVILISLVIAFLYGQTGYLWESGPLAAFFNIKVLVNAAIIGAILYFLLGLLKIKLNSKEGNAGYGILLFLISVVFAVKLGNQWIWEQAVLSQFFSYFIGSGGIFDPSGPEYRLWVFIGAFTMLSFFFSGYLLKGGVGGKNFVSYALAFVMAANMASEGATIGAVVTLGELIFVIMLAHNLQESVKIPGVNWVLAIVIVAWVSAALTIAAPAESRGYLGAGVCYLGFVDCEELAAEAGVGGIAGSAGEGRGGFGGFLSLLGKFSIIVILGVLVGGLFLIKKFAAGKKKGGIIAVAIVLILLYLLMSLFFGFRFATSLGVNLFVPLIIIVLLFMGIVRAENRRRILVMGFGGIKKRLNTFRSKWKFLRDTPEGKEPQVFKENRLLFHALANYTTRSEITYRYWDVVLGAESHAKEIMKDIGEFEDPEALRKDLIAYRSGGKDGNGIERKGWNKLNRKVVDLLNEFFDLALVSVVTADNKLKKGTEFTPNSSKFMDMESRANRLLKDINNDYSQYKLRKEAFGAHHIIRGYRGIILNMSNVTGEHYEHPMKFARPKARFKGGRSYFGNSFEAEADSQGLPVHEVNQYGEYVKDIVEQRDRVTGAIDVASYKKPRKLENYRDIIDYKNFPLFLRNISVDWQGLAEDIRYGLSHPKSRTKDAYTSALGRNIYPEYADDDIKFEHPPSKEDPALDLHVLADPGMNIYWGREEFSDDNPPQNSGDGSTRVNPWPALSSLGLMEFLNTRVELDMKNKELAHEFLEKYPADTGAPRKEINPETGEVTAKIGTTLAAAKKGQKPS